MFALLSKILSIANRYGGNFVANMLQQGLRFLILYAAARQLGPQEFGVVSLLLLVANYLMNANLGAVNGLKRQIPLVYAGEGANRVLHAFCSVLNFNWIATLLLGAIVTLVLVAGFGLRLGPALMLLPLSFSLNSYFSVQTFFTSTGNWKQLFRLQLTCALLLVVAFGSLFWSNGFWLMLLFSLSFLLASLTFFAFHGYKPVLDRAIVFENIRVGFPIMLSGFIYLLFQTTDRLFVSRYFDPASFGQYSFAWVLVMSLNLVVNLSSEMLLQRSATYFAKVRDRKRLLRYMANRSALFFGVLVLISFLMTLVVRYVVPFYFPQYKPTIPIIENLVASYVIQQTTICVANYYFIIGKQTVYNIMLAFSCLINAVILFVPFQGGGNLPSLAQISGLYIWSSCIYAVLLHLPLLRKTMRS